MLKKFMSALFIVGKRWKHRKCPAMRWVLSKALKIQLWIKLTKIPAPLELRSHQWHLCDGWEEHQLEREEAQEAHPDTSTNQSNHCSPSDPICLSRGRKVTAPTLSSFWQFQRMVKHITGRSAFLSYYGYGCYCGLGGKGVPVDDTDRCCRAHDCCYKKLKEFGCQPLLNSYRFHILNGWMQPGSQWQLPLRAEGLRV
ncbi:putative inactive group IIC secretory phospholipase A2 isoform X2 [Fukomys damarensis]|uniref:putative inactive group IIC secretory phospholipase A2 isoform X2 n=1 Tax=Fukomys damarensis TaxID=885580 RepID=UPI001454FBE9|nr:putative inactive group IIC secretory phospholipase A2 isoform X2 [Fukomys damarensis]